MGESWCCTRTEDEKLFSLVEVFRRKIDARVHVPTYPQFRDMIGKFLGMIKEDLLLTADFIEILLLLAERGIEEKKVITEEKR